MNGRSASILKSLQPSKIVSVKQRNARFRKKYVRFRISKAIDDASRQKPLMLRYLVILSFTVIFSCAPRSFFVTSAQLYPLYVYNPRTTETTLFASLSLILESGDTDLRSIRLEQRGNNIFWEQDFAGDELAVSRLPQPDAPVSPSFVTKEAGARVEFFYPWFLSPGDNEMPDGTYTLTGWDYSGQTSQMNLRYKNLSDDSLQALVEHLSLLDLAMPTSQGSYEVLFLPENADPSSLVRMSSEEYLLSKNGISPFLDLNASVFLWGVPRGIDCLVLAGPY